jgi:hypothetical protein
MAAWYNFNRKQKTTLVEVAQTETSETKYEKFFGLDKVAKENLNQPIITERLNNELVYFGVDNLYPNLLNNLYYASSFHAAIINFKNQHLVGQGYELIHAYKSQADMISIHQMAHIFNQEFLEKMAFDYNIHNRLTWKIYWNKEHTKVIGIERMDPAKIRSQKKVNGVVKTYVYNSDWGYKNNYQTKEYLPAFDTFAKKEQEQLFVWQGFAPGLDYYTQPAYAAATNFIYLDGQISFYHKSNIENSINPSMIIKMYEKPANDREQQEFIHNMRRSFTGASNAGKMLVFFSNSKEEAPDVQTVEPNSLDETFLTTQKSIIENISYAHGMSPILLGVSQPGSLGNSNELEMAYKIFNNVYTKPSQDTLNKILTMFYGVNNLNVVVKLNEVNVNI